MSGNVDIFHSRRTHYAECYYWIRDERNTVDKNKWVLENKSNGVFYAKEISPKTNQMNQAGGVFAFDRDIITLQTNDDISKISRGCIVTYNGKPWIVDNVQSETHRKESQFSVEIEYSYILSLRS